MSNNRSMKDLIIIAMGVAAMIGGGFVIFQISLVFPIPGVKYIMMAPYLSMMIYIILNKVKHKNAIFGVGITFSLIMTLINLYMGLAIITTTLLAALSTIGMKKQHKTFWAASGFSGYTGLTTLIISKYMIGGAFQSISPIWIVTATILCFGFGIGGVVYAKKVLRYLTKYSFET